MCSWCVALLEPDLDGSGCEESVLPNAQYAMEDDTEMLEARTPE